MKMRRFSLPILLGAAVALVLSCREPTPLEAPHRLLGDLSLDSTISPLGIVDSLVHNGGLLTCTPQPADSASAVIGFFGGTIQAGGDTLSVPAGALLDTVTITMTAPSDTVNHVHFEPEGLTFQTPASLTMSYANCNTLGVNIPKQIAYTDDLLVILEYLKSWDTKNAQTVRGEVNHFSEYAIAW